MEKIYEIVHCYDVDGGFGDAIPQEEVIGVFDDEEIAEEYVRRWSKPEVYDRPYCSLYHHELFVREKVVNALDINEDPWLN